VVLDGSAFLLPTVVRCDSPEHPLARTEFLFPFVAVVEVPREDLVEALGPSLVVTAITEDAALAGALLRASHVDRLNLGPLPTTRVEWDQPHEGNLFEFLYRRRAVQGSGAAVS
jgi:acyl-CoA reductase-like NAD-dependent aldehyde dehydrogenase